MIDAFAGIALLAIVAVMVVAFLFGALILKALDKLRARFARPPAGCSFCGTPTDRLA